MARLLFGVEPGGAIQRLAKAAQPTSSTGDEIRLLKVVAEGVRRIEHLARVVRQIGPRAMQPFAIRDRRKVEHARLAAAVGGVVTIPRCSGTENEIGSHR